MADFLANLNILRIDILPYHKLGIPKYEMLGRKYELVDISPPSKEALSNILKMLSSYGFNTRIEE